MKIFLGLIFLANLIFLIINALSLREEHLQSEIDVIANNDQSILLLSEVLESEKSTEGSHSSTNNLTKECLQLIGTWSKPEELESVRNHLKQISYPHYIEQKIKHPTQRYWAYLPSFTNKEEAVAARQQLRLAGIKDQFILKQGQRKNSISLGLFSKKGLAEKRKQHINSLKLGLGTAVVDTLNLHVERQAFILPPPFKHRDQFVHINGLIDQQWGYCPKVEP